MQMFSSCGCLASPECGEDVVRAHVYRALPECPSALLVP